MPPSFLHQGMTKLVAEHPEIWPELLRRGLGLELDEDLQVMQGPETVRQLRAPDHIADGTIVLQRIRDGTVTGAIVNEIQRDRDDDKWWTWPLHLSGVRARLRCPVILVVLTPKRSVARWASRPIDMGHGCMILRPLVIGPDQIPSEMDLDYARQHPALATLAVMMHGRKGGSKRLTQNALRAVLDHDRTPNTLMLDLIAGSLPLKTLMEIEDEMQFGTEVSFTKIGRRKYAEGHQQGLQQGRLEARRQAITLVLESRGLDLTATQRRRLERCIDDVQLDRWLRRAGVVEQARQLFAR